MKCPYCAYEWTPRKPNPLSCPKCKRRLDQLPKRLAVDPLLKAKDIERGFQRTTYVMSVLTTKFEAIGIKAVIVGGAAVEFYTADWYSTSDIDLAITRGKMKEFGETLEEMGFVKDGRFWTRDDLKLYIEAPGNIDELSMDNVTKVESENGYVYFIGLEEIIFDRIEAAKHWKSEGDKQQAIRMATNAFDDIDWNYLKKRCKEDNSDDVLTEVREAAKDARDKSR